MYKIGVESFFFLNLQQMVSDKAFLLGSIFDPKALSAPALGLFTREKNI